MHDVHDLQMLSLQKAAYGTSRGLALPIVIQNEVKRSFLKLSTLR